ncbi:hypothetical protein K431DRAFT_236585 [Polychaeton citri CBS 116435]|uniref:Uncharacterized protein n=1 Tax=Polychaeton citri CBS 116435 TaxID=1314669 RepID=A0A9P4UHM6_9PEZI|nr:hypothetical protein K431DRAFT_236585 [Polychaeton citri CBS 116435]
MATRSLSGAATLTERDSSSETCKGDETSGVCQKPTSGGNNGTLTIVLGAVIPITVALLVLFYLHRRLVRKRREEDANDKYKSLDFGDGAGGTNKAAKDKNIPEMSVTDLGDDFNMKGTRRPKGMSMDMNMGSPYLLPAGLQNSRESIHSMSRSLHDEHDPYRQVAAMGRDNDSTRSPTNPFDGGSVYSASTGLASTHDTARLVPNAQRMSKSYSLPSSHDLKADDGTPPVPAIPGRKQSLASGDIPLEELSRSGHDGHALPPVTPGKASPPPMPETVDMPMRTTSIPPQPTISTPSERESSNYGDDPPAPMPSHFESTYDIDPAAIYLGSEEVVPQASNHLVQPQPVGKRLSVLGLRPLPPDNPEDNPEQRANRIRSFYKEYFDGGKVGTSDEYDGDVLADGAIFDPETGGFVTGGAKPWNQNVGRRAMTPPPRGAPRTSGRSSGPGPHRRHLSTGMRGRVPVPQPKKKLPPPKPLVNLSTPHLLKDDSAIFNAADFAPPTSFRQLQNGSRPDSPMSGTRAYSPTIKPHTPIVSSFDELKVMPSPHELRKSSTFTSLDFAPPRFRGQDGASDAGSIRSNRSGISAFQNDAIRAGAYRVSRIPKEVVMSREDLTMQLKPTWEMRDKAPLV